MESTSKILIVGGGITGTALAALLEQKGIIADVVEKMPNWSKEGFGITVMPAGLEVLRKLELVTDTREKGISARNIRIFTEKGKLVRQFHMKSEGVDSITLDRAHLHKALRSKLSKTHIKLDKTIKMLVHKDNSVEVTFTDNTKKEYALVIGTDGVHSITRSLIFPGVGSKYTGVGFWTFFLPPGVELDSRSDVLQVWNDDEVMGIFPSKDHVAVFFATPLDRDMDMNAIDLDKHFDDITFHAHDILRKIKNKDTYSGFMNEMKLGTWHEGRVILAGDAAHAMMPATGMGASMGLQDAYVLATLIGQTPPESWAHVGEQYQKVRKHIVDRVQRDAHSLGHLMLWGSPLKEGRNAALKWVPQFVVTHGIENQ
jgi:2-polyprenyl-6-methoxyphenol hydroxylase-like FAD-dependent oxidoreductase